MAAEDGRGGEVFYRSFVGGLNVTSIFFIGIYFCEDLENEGLVTVRIIGR